MKIFAFLLNLPWTLVGLFLAILSIPRNLNLHYHPFAFIFRARSLWWLTWQKGKEGARAFTMGSVIVLGEKVLEKDLEHELVHVLQFEREPFVMPFLYEKETLLRGYRNNKYEDEAYTTTGSVYLGK